MLFNTRHGEKIMTKTKNKKIIIILLVLLLLVLAIMAAKKHISGAKNAAAGKRPPAVQLVKVKSETINDKLTSAGRIEAKYSVDIVARVQGWIKKSYFTEGSMVKKGDLLFLIEPDNYEIAVKQAEADLKRAEADYVNAEKDLVRADELVKLDYVSKSYYDQALAKRDMTKAAVAAAKATLSNAKLNLSYTKVTAPVDGKVGKILITEGNLVDPSAGAITRLVSTTPIYAYFNVKSEDYLNFKQNQDKNLADCTVELTLSDGSAYDRKGKVEFVDNEVDPTVGTIALRATFDNPSSILVPNDYVNVTITSNKPRSVILVPQEAVQESKDGMLVYTVNAENHAIPIIIEADGQYNGKWIVTKGLKAGDKVVEKGLLSITRPNMEVVPVDMEENAEKTEQAIESQSVGTEDKETKDK